MKQLDLFYIKEEAQFNEKSSFLNLDSNTNKKTPQKKKRRTPSGVIYLRQRRYSSSQRCKDNPLQMTFWGLNQNIEPISQNQLSTSNLKDIEIEIRIWLHDDTNLVQWLEKNARYIGQSNQEDIYYQPKISPFINSNDSGIRDADEWLRIRVLKNGGAILCYKKWHRDIETKKSLYADEIETKVEDKDSLIKILHFLGYEVISGVIKNRQSWEYGNFRIDKDTIEDLGTFYEIEFKGEIENPEEGNSIIYNFFKELKLSEWKVIDRGYPWMQWNPNWRNG